jgi:hypothetical protein
MRTAITSVHQWIRKTAKFLRRHWTICPFSNPLVYILLLLGSLHADYLIFTPPKDWEIVNPQFQTSCVKINFIGKSSKEYRPSLNLAIEDADISMNEYLAVVRKIHEADPNRKWRDLGKYPVPAGEARLTEIESRNGVGEIRLLQLITIKDKTAYVITATSLKEEFFKYYKDFQDVFRSVKFTSNLIEAVPNLHQRNALQEHYKKMVAAKKKSREDPWLSFQEAVSIALKEEFSRFYKDFKTAQKQDKERSSEELWSTFQENAIQSMKNAFTHSHQEFERYALCPTPLTKVFSLTHLKEPPSLLKKNRAYGKTASSDPLWNSFQETVINEYKDMGAYWQVLMLQYAREKLNEE